MSKDLKELRKQLCRPPKEENCRQRAQSALEGEVDSSWQRSSAMGGETRHP